MTAYRSGMMKPVVALLLGWLLVSQAAPQSVQAQSPDDAESVFPGPLSGQLRKLMNSSTSQPAANEPEAPAEAGAGAGETLSGEPISAADAADEDHAPDIQVSKDGRVEMHVRDLNLASVLQMLSMQSQGNIIASKDVSGKVTANLYNVTFEEAPDHPDRKVRQNPAYRPACT